MTSHQYGISALVFQMSFRRETSDGVAKCRLFTQAKRVFGFWDVFWILGSVFGFWNMFWILESVFGFWEVFCPYEPL